MVFHVITPAFRLCGYEFQILYFVCIPTPYIGCSNTIMYFREAAKWEAVIAFECAKNKWIEFRMILFASYCYHLLIGFHALIWFGLSFPLKRCYTFTKNYYAVDALLEVRISHLNLFKGFLWNQLFYHISATFFLWSKTSQCLHLCLHN